MKHLSILLLAGLSVALFSCNQYGKKLTFGKGEVYYKNVEEATAQKLGDWLKEFTYFDDTNTKSVQLDKKDDTYLVRFVVDESKLTEDITYGFEIIGYMIREEVLDGKPTIVELCNNTFKTFKSITVTDSAFGGDGEVTQ